jgi:hypothetical protein
MPLLVATAFLAFFYGLVWHNRPARERNPDLNRPPSQEARIHK